MSTDKSEKYKGDSKKDINRFIARNTSRALGIESFNEEKDIVTNIEFSEEEEKEEKEEEEKEEKEEYNEEDYFWFKGKRYKRGNRPKKKYDNVNQGELGYRFFEFLNNSFNFTGKINRRDYWITVLQLGCIYLFLISLIALSSSDNLEGFIESSTKSGWIVAIITFIPNLAIQVRRLNDIGKEPAWVLLSFVPFLSLILIFWYAKPSQNSQLNENKKRSDYININSVDELAEAEEKLAKLKSMLERGVISAQEYEELRKKTLGL